MSKISGIWEVPYTCEMGIEKHCRLILTLIDNLETAKASYLNPAYDMKREEEALRNEMADLAIILEKYFELTGTKVIDERVKKFNNFQKEDEKFLKREK